MAGLAGGSHLTVPTGEGAPYLASEMWVCRTLVTGGPPVNLQTTKTLGCPIRTRSCGRVGKREPLNHRTAIYDLPLPSGLKRHQGEGHHHFVTFSCYRRLPFLHIDTARILSLERHVRPQGQPGTILSDSRDVSLAGGRRSSTRSTPRCANVRDGGSADSTRMASQHMGGRMRGSLRSGLRPPVEMTRRAPAACGGDYE